MVMFTLVLAGELIFSLPFHVPRYFRPTVLEALGFSNANLGDVFAVYGVTAMLAYFPGGAIADRYSARRLMALSLAATAAGGLYMITLPGLTGMALLYGWWGVTTILLFWAAMIRATRAWGGAATQGLAFGLLDGGRGLTAALFATLAVALFSAALPDGDAHGSLREGALGTVIGFYTLATAAAAVLVWLFVPEPPAGTLVARGDFADLRAVLRERVVWLQAGVVVCAYCGYKGLDNYALYAYDVLGMTETEAASFTATAAWLRPVAALSAGLLADRAGAARTVGWTFAVLAAAYALLGVLDAHAAVRSIVLTNLGVSFFGVFALRGVYFALLEHTQVPRALTGAAVGLISLVGYTPDVFFAPVAGRLLDASPGIAGHQHYFLLLAGIAIIGLVAAAALGRHGAVSHATARAGAAQLTPGESS